VTSEEGAAVAALGRLATVLGVELPVEVLALFGSALRWAGCDPSRNSLTPGFAPLECSFSTWQPRELRVAAQLFASLTESERRTGTVDVVRQLAGRYLASAIPDINGSCAVGRFGAFFGLTAGPGGLTGVEAYLEGDCREAGPPDRRWESIRPMLRVVFTGVGIRDGAEVRRAYLAVAGDLEEPMLGHAVSEAVPPDVASDMLRALRDLTGGRRVLPEGTVMVTSAHGEGICSVEIQAAAYGLELSSLPALLHDLRSTEYARWVAAVGGRHAVATVVSIRFSERDALGAAIYAIPAWLAQPASPRSRPMACPSTDWARTRPVA
jgi:hypothetical protein